MTERELQKAVMDTAKFFGWRVAHFDASVRVVGKERRFVGDKGAKGFPDLIMVKGKRIIIAELKGERGYFQPLQKEWLADLGAALDEVYIWRPQDWTSGNVQAILSCK